MNYPSPAALSSTWESLGGQNYLLSTNRQDLDHWTSLAEFSTQLGNSPHGDGPSQAQLTALDQIASALIDLTERLHAEQRGLGMLTAENAVWNGVDTIHPMDHGFCVPENALIPPKWMREPPIGHVFWDQPIETQQWTAFADQPIDPEADVRLLIRLLQFLMLGVRSNDLIKLEEIKSHHRTKSMRFWNNIVDVFRDPGSDAVEKLRRVLSQTPPSAHFTKAVITPPPHSPSRGPLILVGLGFVALIALLIGLGIQFWPKPPAPPVVSDLNSENIPPPEPQGDEVPDGTEVDDSLASVDLESSALVDLTENWVSIVKEQGGATELSDPEKVSLEKRATEILERWQQDFSSTRNDFEQESKRSAAFQQLTEQLTVMEEFARVDLSEFSPELAAERQKCIEFLRTLINYPRLRTAREFNRRLSDLGTLTGPPEPE
ncbi:hypothetical protein [Thalassoroseus pseudoceratinae]|uniref:hypothetical protein n=1 Tax=Thalassoroseus pseudoceratinae TaxID=2713176 RepID=UPI0014228400|nr:hypothetical protein [Thalassoroseus pseudoceratinae]